MNDLMNLYRVDTRVFKLGDSIGAQGLYQNALDDQRTVLEEALEKARPDRFPSRGSVLMLFSTYECAETLWKRMIGAYLYEVQINKTTVQFQGDMGLTEQMYQEGVDSYAALAAAYWNGDRTTAPCIEVFVKTAQVTRICRTADQRVDERKRQLGIDDDTNPYEGLKME